MNRLQLPDVTLVCVDTVCHDLATMALAECTERAKFGEILWVSDRPIGWPDAKILRYHRIKPCSGTQAEMHCWYTVPPLVRTSHYLIVQWDSWIINPDAWTDEFIEYDYIGAPWGWHGDEYEVGNGGFSLRSTALGNFVAQSPATLPLSSPEDAAICRTHRKRLEDGNGFRWAPLPLAYRFSRERTEFPPVTPFGYHGIFNWPSVLTAAQIAERMALAPPYVRDSADGRHMMSIAG